MGFDFVRPPTEAGLPAYARSSLPSLISAAVQKIGTTAI